MSSFLFEHDPELSAMPSKTDLAACPDISDGRDMGSVTPWATRQLTKCIVTTNMATRHCNLTNLNIYGSLRMEDRMAADFAPFESTTIQFSSTYLLSVHSCYLTEYPHPPGQPGCRTIHRAAFPLTCMLLCYRSEDLVMLSLRTAGYKLSMIP